MKTQQQLQPNRTVQLIFRTHQEFVFSSPSQTPFVLTYSTEFDPYDFMAAARFIYEISTATPVQTYIQYIKTIPKKEFIQILVAVNNCSVVHSPTGEKILIIDFNPPNHLGHRQPRDDPQVPAHYLVPQDVLRRFALIIPEPEYHESWEQILEALYLGMYKEPNEQWDVYLAFKNQFPANLEELDGLVITGSSSSAYDDTLPWLGQLCRNLEETYLKLKNLKILGICFGHQVIAAALGGKAVKMNHLPRYQVGRVQLTTSFVGVGNLNVYVLHGDEVVDIPADTKVFLEAPHCEIYGYRNDRMICVQFHPEFNPTMLLYAIDADPYLGDQYKRLDIERCSKTFEEGRDDSLLIWQHLLKFLKAK